MAIDKEIAGSVDSLVPEAFTNLIQLDLLNWIGRLAPSFVCELAKVL